MKTKFYPVHLILLFSLLLAGCSAGSVQLRSKEGNFSVKAPVTLEEMPQSIDISSGKKETHTYLAEKDGIAYVATYIVFDESSFSQGSLEDMLNNARDSMVNSVSGKLAMETRITLGDYPGRDVTISYTTTDGKDGLIRARLYLVKPNLYQVMVLVDKGQENTASVSSFLDSFKLLKNP